MADRYTVTTNVSWGSRIKGAFGGIVVGLLFFVVAFPLLFWNEGNAVNTARALEEGAGVVVTVPPSPIDPANEGKLVHFSGEATTDALLTDPSTGVNAVGIQLVRQVEMF
ncbi:MAG: hypothetical protein HQK87_07225 [Nitrospinae bacterium]|nr:hypothetical protein [Nitrospinota bacterium]